MINIFNRKEHWENIYNTKNLTQVGWYQEKPIISLDFLSSAHLSKNSKIIDVGGGESRFVDYLLDGGYKDITVLDISESAIIKAQQRLGDDAQKVKWIISDITEFQPSEKYDFWHDRAAFHFLIDAHDVKKYVSLVQKAITPCGQVVVGTFSTDGPSKCSGIPIHQYTEDTLNTIFQDDFEKINSFYHDHITPSGQLQNFIFCHFRSKIR